MIQLLKRISPRIVVGVFFGVFFFALRELFSFEFTVIVALSVGVGELINQSGGRGPDG